MENKEIDAFRQIVRELLDIEMEGDIGQPVKCELPRSLFMTSIHSLKKGKPLSKDEMRRLGEEFLFVLDQNKVRISDEDKKFFSSEKEKHRSWFSSSVMAGARAAQIRHDGVLKYDQ
jgi:hypothetical protein